MLVWDFLLVFLLYLVGAHYFSYLTLKNKVLRRQRWDLNICCGKTDGGGINVDIIRHKDVPNFILIDNIYQLPFEDKQFNYVLCSHTIEHINDPIGLYRELNRVGNNIVLIIPPLWDIAAAFFSQREHKWIFLTFRKEHSKLPRFITLPFASTIQKIIGQKIKA